MGWFGAIQDNQKINRKIIDLEDRLETLERKLRSLDQEWMEFYDKTRHSLGRIVKRAAIVEKSQQEEGGTPEAESNPPESPLLDGLSARQRFLNQQILMSRGSRGQL